MEERGDWMDDGKGSDGWMDGWRKGVMERSDGWMGERSNGKGSDRWMDGGRKGVMERSDGWREERSYRWMEERGVIGWRMEERSIRWRKGVIG